MIPEFQKLTPKEQSLLISAPAIVSILTASAMRELKELETADGIKLTHLKTFAAHPMLVQYYEEVEKDFEQNFEYLVKVYSPFNDSSRELLGIKVEKINAILEKLDPEFAVTLRASLSGYADHVKKAYKGLIVSFHFPFPILE